MATTAPPIPRLELALTPTPLLPLERLSRDVGVELWVKRDDLTGLAESGNEIRKLEFLLGEATAQGADTLIGAGTHESNACRTIAAVAARLGMRAVLALHGDRPAELDGNLLLATLFGADIRYLGAGAPAKIDETLEDLAVEVRAAGGAPYVIPGSGATVAGALGYVTCAQELHAQIRHGAPDFDTVAITAVTGASQAGLLMGKQLTGLGARIAGVPVAPAADIRDSVRAVIARAARKYAIPVTPPDDVELVDDHAAHAERDDLETLVRVARAEGVVLDPVHTAKAFGILLEAIRREPGRFGRRVCFVHTGGIFGLFPFRGALRGLLGPDGRGGRW